MRCVDDTDNHNKNNIPRYLSESFDIHRRINIDNQDEWTKFTLEQGDFQNYADTLRLLNRDDLNKEIYGLYNSPLPFTNDIPCWWPKVLRGKEVLKNADLNEYIIGKYIYDFSENVCYYRYCFLNPVDTTVYWFTYRFLD